MTAPCFVDAKVFVYARDPRDAAKQSRALHWIAHLWQERLGRTSVQVLSEYYVLATRTLKPHVAPGAAWVARLCAASLRGARYDEGRVFALAPNYLQPSAAEVALREGRVGGLPS